MKLFVCALLLFYASPLHAQDPDIPDYRSKKDNFAKMQEKDIRNDLSSFVIAGIDESMGKPTLRSIPMKDYGTNFMTFEGENIRVTVKTGLFVPAKHKLSLYEEKHLVRIDSKPFYGSFGTVPKTTIESITVLIGKDTVSIPPTAFFDLYNPSFSYRDASGTELSLNAVYLSPDYRKIYIYMLNRERTGTYEVTWVIQDKKYLRRVVDFGLLK